MFFILCITLEYLMEIKQLNEKYVSFRIIYTL